jgi:hypothetical protein
MIYLKYYQAVTLCGTDKKAQGIFLFTRKFVSIPYGTGFISREIDFISHGIGGGVTGRYACAGHCHYHPALPSTGFPASG